MARSISPLLFLVLSTLAASFTEGCSGSGSQPPNAAVLDPTQSHYGQTDDEWGALWQQWIYQLPQTNAQNCIIPFSDPTGANCGYGQSGDSGQSGDVFFLAGTQGGTVVRDQCVVPLGKAIFFPILSFSADNAGVPAAMQLSDMALIAYVQNELNTVPVSGLSAEFAGVALTNLGRFATKVTQYSYTLPPEPNVYDCGGQTGVTGTYSSYAAGFFVMLAPPASGAHTLHFAGSSPMSQPPLSINVTYNFMVK